MVDTYNYAWRVQESVFAQALNNPDWIMQSKAFADFLALTTDRCSFICEWLSLQRVPYSTVKLGEKTHIIVKFSTVHYNSKQNQKTFVAHYDRETNTQGANDNSAACFQLMLFSVGLLHFPKVHNVKIIFTDGEEAGASGIRQQGAYALGVGLKKLKMENDDIFVFDMCGNGDTLIISQAGIFGRDARRVEKIRELHARSCRYAEHCVPQNWISLLTAYSDNAGFLAAGLKAQIITILPRSEAERLAHHLGTTAPHKSLARKDSALATLQNYIITNKKAPANSPLNNIIPPTWQKMHTPQDSLQSLNSSAFALAFRFLMYLAEQV